MKSKRDLINELITLGIVFIGLLVLFLVIQAPLVAWLICMIPVVYVIIQDVQDLRSKNYQYKVPGKTKLKITDGNITATGLWAEGKIPCENVTRIQIWGRQEFVNHKDNKSPETITRKEIIERINIETDRAIYSFDIPDTEAFRPILSELKECCTNATIETDYEWSEP